ncbi:MAG: hypothetical protein IJO18_01795 [Alphaproteobacteria bacterium]|nr:hypothetical protein [Alphaproteobacteria bacterium]
MKKNFENILLGLLWLMVATLGTTFWFNTRFGFNLFSGAHWDYLATQQASRTPVSFWFYFSFVAATFITLFVLYLLIKPRRRHIKISAPQKPNTAPKTNPDASQINIIPGTVQHAPTTPVAPTAAPMPPRPPRLNIAPANTFAPATPMPTTMTPTIPATATTPSVQTKQDWPEIREIFSMAGYVIKPEPFINGKKMALLAIGTDEVLYLGAVGISTSQMQGCVNKLQQIFRDTLDDIEITVNAFVLNPTGTNADESILTFNSIDELRHYMNEHRNTPLNTDDAENFAAYSEYITTVIEYIGKL